MEIKYFKSIKNLIYKVFKKISQNNQQIAQLVGAPEHYKLKQEFQFNFLIKQNLKPQHKLLDIGCGILRGGLPIIEYLNEGNYTGIDIRKKSITIAKKEVRKHGLSHKKPRIIHFSSLDTLHIKTKFDYILAYSVLIHVNDNELERILRFVSKIINKKGAFYANVNVGKRKDGKWQDFPVVWRSEEHYRKLCKRYDFNYVKTGSLKDLGHKTGQLDDNQLMLKFSAK